MTRKILFIFATLLGTVVFSFLVLVVAKAIVGLFNVDEADILYQRYPEFIGSFIFLIICLPLVKMRNLNLWKHAILSFTFGGTVLSLMLLYPMIKHENKAELFNKYSMYAGYVTAVLWLAGFYINVVQPLMEAGS